MRLSELAREMHGVEQGGSGDPGILSLSLDSRQTEAGALFIAMSGCRDEGAAYVNEAIRRGAVAVLADCMPRIVPGFPCLVAENVRKAAGEAADAFYRHPARNLDLIGVTGTNGKTTTAYLLRHIFNHMGRRCGMLGTIEYDLGNKIEPAPLTTPDAVHFTRFLAEMRDFGCAAAVAEASSHALVQERTWPHRFACGIFTNLTRDHLDYHGDMERYLEAKRSLFLRLDEKAAAVFNCRDPHAGRMAEACRARKFGYELQGDGSFRQWFGGGAVEASIVESDLRGQTFHVVGCGMDMDFRTSLIGAHNVENCLGAILAAVALGIGPRAVAEALAEFPGVPGRLERVASPPEVGVFVDFAHTDDALRSVLTVLRPLTKGRLITVFGCGGDRDKGKRSLMARAAAELSDRVVVTSDNPRTEDPAAIIRDIMAGFPDPGKVEVEPDRAAAMRLAAGLLRSGDTLLAAGKGHENYQIIGTEKRHMDDRELLRNAFAGWKGGGA